MRTDITLELLIALVKEANNHLNEDIKTATPTSFQNTYESLFRIDGQPILPPLMTTEKRSVMLRFKAAAIERENRIEGAPNCLKKTIQKVDAKYTTMSQIVELSDTNRFYAGYDMVGENKVQQATNIVEYKRLQFLQQSEKFVYDANSNEIILSKSKLPEMMDASIGKVHHCNYEKQHVGNNLVSTHKLKYFNSLRRPLSPTLNNEEKHRTLICVGPPTLTRDIGPKLSVHMDNVGADLLKYTKLDLCSSPHRKEPLSNMKEKIDEYERVIATLNKRDSLQQITKSKFYPKNVCVSSDFDDKGYNLIRSNSFTLERPSKVLLEHIKRQKAEYFAEPKKFSVMATSSERKPAQKIHVQYQKCCGSSLSNFQSETTESSTKGFRTIDVKKRMAHACTNLKITKKLPNSKDIGGSKIATKPSISKTLNVHRRSRASTPQKSAHSIAKNNTYNNCQFKNKTYTRSKLLNANQNSKQNQQKYDSFHAVQSQTQHRLSTNQCCNSRSPKIFNTLTEISPPITTKQPIKSNSEVLQLQQQVSRNQCSKQQKPSEKTFKNRREFLQRNLGQQQRRISLVSLSPTILNNKIIKGVESSHQEMFMKLIAQQRKEQYRLQTQFDTQQKLLIEHICSKLNTSQFSEDDDIDYIYKVLEANIHPHKSNVARPGITESSAISKIGKFQRQSKDIIPVSSLTPIITTSTTTTIINGISTTAIIPRCTDQYNGLLNSDLKKGHSNQGSSNNSWHSVFKNESYKTVHVLKPKPKVTKNVKSMVGTLYHENTAPNIRVCMQNEYDLNRLHNAATIINAYVRGYLVRRLFRTDKIQGFVETIRDTLITVISMHLEASVSTESLENVYIKSRLLTQLSNAIQKLHSIFFQTSKKELMDIISSDRNRLRERLLNMYFKRCSPRFMKE